MRLFAATQEHSAVNLMWVAILTVILLVITLFTSTAKAAIVSGSLTQYLNTYDFGAKGSNAWKIPNSEVTSSFSAALNALIEQNLPLADELAQSFGYRAIEFSDNASNQTVYILEEIAKAGDNNFIGGGTYVVNPMGKPIALEAPHPKFDTFTSTQAIETFVATQSQFLLLAGTRRDSNIAKSECSGDYFESDVAHQTNSLFSTAHELISALSNELVFVQFHGFGSTSLKSLQQQCNTSNTNVVNLSEGVNYYTSPNETSFLHILRSEIESRTPIAACVYGNQTQSLGGTFNVQGRVTNLSSDSCHANAQASSKRFIHLEQSYNVRKSLRGELAAAIDAAIIRYTSN